MERENQESIRNPDGTFKPGVSGNPEGRPKGKTLKEYARDFYMLKNEEEKKAYLQNLEEKRPGFAWEMAEGRPQQDITSGGEKLPQPLYVPRDNSTEEDQHDEEADSSSAGGNSSE